MQQQLAERGVDTASVHVHVGGKNDGAGSEVGDDEVGGETQKRIELRVVIDEEAVGDGE